MNLAIIPVLGFVLLVFAFAVMALRKEEGTSIISHYMNKLKRFFQS